MSSSGFINLKERIRHLQTRGSAWYTRIDQLSGSRLSIFQNALAQFTACRTADAASSLAFWAVFSLFPLMAIIVAVTSFFVGSSQILETVNNLLSPIFPFSTSLITMNLARFIRLRGAFGFVGTLGFIWSASNVFIIIYNNINVAWDKARFRNILQRRLIALGSVAIIMVLLVIFLALTSVLDILRKMEIPVLLVLIDKNSQFLRLVATLAPTVLTFILFFVIYRYMPNTRVRNSDASWAALICTAVWELTSNLFTWYLNSGLATYDLLFGSLATIAVLMLWFYLNSAILLLGAHISAAISKRRLLITIAPDG